MWSSQCVASFKCAWCMAPCHESGRQIELRLIITPFPSPLISICPPYRNAHGGRKMVLLITDTAGASFVVILCQWEMFRMLGIYIKELSALNAQQTWRNISSLHMAVVYWWSFSLQHHQGLGLKQPLPPDRTAQPASQTISPVFLAWCKADPLLHFPPWCV